MDPRRFDSVVRALASNASRRGALGTFTGGLLGLAAVAVGWDAIEAKNKKKRKRKKRKRRKKKQQAAITPPAPLPPAPPPASPPPPSAGCQTAAQCPKPASPCLIATCKNGECGEAMLPGGDKPGNPCDNGEFCNGLETCAANGQCQAGTPPNCDDGIACTIDSCADTVGGCMHIPDDGLCGPNQFCDPVHGCVCIDGFAPCGQGCYQPGAPCGSNVGQCTAGTLQCLNGGTDIACVGGQGPVPETCNGLDDDCDEQVDNGAVCPNVANAQNACLQGSCVITCQAGFGDCDGIAANGCETNLVSNSLHCGTCNNPCLQGTVCSGGMCA